MMRRLVTTLVAVAVAGTLWAGAAAAGEEQTVRASAAWVGKGQFFKTGETEALFIGAFGGVLYVESMTGAMDSAELICPGSMTINLENGRQAGNGKCIIGTSSGETIFAEWACEGVRGAGCIGTFVLKAGTGKYQGITGQSPLAARTELSAIAVDLQSGAVVEAGAGLLVLPELKFKLR